MGEVHGKDAVVKIDNAADVLTDVSTYVKSVTHNRTADTHDITTFGDSWKEFIVGLKDGTEVTFEGNFDPASGLQHDIFLAAYGATKTVELDPAGTAAGMPKISFEVIGTGYTVSPSHDDRLGFSFTAKVTGAITDGTN